MVLGLLGRIRARRDTLGLRVRKRRFSVYIPIECEAEIKRCYESEETAGVLWYGTPPWRRYRPVWGRR